MPAARTRADLKREIEALRDEVARLGVGVTPLVLECHRRGDFGETRPPGAHYDDPLRRTGLVLVYEGDEPPPELIARFVPESGPSPLIITFGPEHAPPPPDEPAPLD